MVLTWKEFTKRPSPARLAATIGVFDGVHLGHQALIETVKRESPLYPCVITFQENPKKCSIPQTIEGVS